jgi:hypothetical protein
MWPCTDNRSNLGGPQHNFMTALTASVKTQHYRGKSCITLDGILHHLIEVAVLE